jgi:hypothetical protein
MDDKEIEAMATASKALKDLSEEERTRVIQWLAAKYMNAYPVNQSTPRNSKQLVGSASDQPAQDEDESDGLLFDTFAEMLDSATATTATGRALIAAYWIQTVEGQDSWKSFELNKILKETGNFDDHLTESLRSLREAKPTKVIQVNKPSTEKGKGHRIMKLTTHGVKEAEKLLHMGKAI